jgi:hypothetical protein
MYTFGMGRNLYMRHRSVGVERYIAILMTSLCKRKTFNYILRVRGRENDTGLVVKKLL